MERTIPYRLRLRWDGDCFVCGRRVLSGQCGWYDPTRRQVACGNHELTPPHLTSDRSALSNPASPPPAEAEANVINEPTGVDPRPTVRLAAPSPPIATATGSVPPLPIGELLSNVDVRPSDGSRRVVNMLGLRRQPSESADDTSGDAAAAPARSSTAATSSTAPGSIVHEGRPAPPHPAVRPGVERRSVPKPPNRGQPNLDRSQFQPGDVDEAEHDESEHARREFAVTDHRIGPAKRSRRPPPASGEPRLPKLIKARYDSTCTACGCVISTGAELFWVPGTKVVVCPACTAAEVSAGFTAATPPNLDDPDDTGSDVGNRSPTTGRPGGSALRIATANSRRHAERLLAAYPMLGEYLVANARPTATVHGWMRGADGERVVGRELDAAARAGKLVALHDRRSPAGGNIDHLTVGHRRICVIDAKHYRNARVHVVGGVLRVGDHPAEHLIDGVLHQRSLVSDALAERSDLVASVSAVLAFVGARFGILGPILHRDVYCAPVAEAVSYAAFRHRLLGGDRPIRLDAIERARVGGLIDRTFPPA